MRIGTAACAALGALLLLLLLFQLWTTRRDEGGAWETFGQTLSGAWLRGWTGGAAMCAQVVLTIGLRTVVNVQSQRGGTCWHTVQALYREGGIARFYRGLGPALLLAPLSRVGAIVSNTLALHLMRTDDALWLKTLVGTLGAMAWRVLILPLDTAKTALQVEGAHGAALLRRRVAGGGVLSLYRGASALAAQTLLSSFAFFWLHSFMTESWPRPPDFASNVWRNGVIGFCCAAAGEIAGNSVRVLKVVQQTSELPISYGHIYGAISGKGGARELFTRGLGVRLVSNGIQGVFFNILWKILEEHMQAASSTAIPEHAAAAAARDESRR